jgi:hypothetical protein
MLGQVDCNLLSSTLVARLYPQYSDDITEFKCYLDNNTRYLNQYIVIDITFSDGREYVKPIWEEIILTCCMLGFTLPQYVIRSGNNVKKKYM